MEYYKQKIDMKDINYTVELDFFESIHGCTKKINVSYYKICDICNGIGKINSTICPDCKMKILNKEITKDNILDTNTDLNISIDQDLNQESINELNIDLKHFDLNDDNNSSKQENQIIENKVCEKCHNTGYIFLSNCPICKNGLKQTEKEVILTIKPRCDETTRYIIKNFNKGINGGKNGNLIVNFKVINNTKFKIINDYDVQFKLDINMKDAILGKVFAIPTIYQKYYKLVIPKFTQQGKKIIINNLGLLKESKNQDKHSINTYGDMIIKINVLIPENLNDKQLKLIKQLM